MRASLSGTAPDAALVLSGEIHLNGRISAAAGIAAVNIILKYPLICGYDKVYAGELWRSLCLAARYTNSNRTDHMTDIAFCHQSA